MSIIYENCSQDGPLISIVIAVFNGAKTMQRCLDSITKQVYSRKELIIMDGGSSDGTIDILRNNSNNITFWSSEPDKGIYNAWNKALRFVTGQWVCFLGADDYFYSENTLDEVAPFLANAYPRYRVVYGNVLSITECGSPIEIITSAWSRKKFVSRGMYFSHQGVFHHVALFVNGGYNEQYHIAADYELLLRELKDKDALYLPAITVAAMQIGGMSTADDSGRLKFLEFGRAQQAHGFEIRWSLRLAVVRSRFQSLVYRTFGQRVARLIVNSTRMLMGKQRKWSNP